MRIIHSGGFPIDERRQTRAVIYSNMIVAFKLLIEIMEAENISFEHEATEVCMTIAPSSGSLCSVLCSKYTLFLIMIIIIITLSMAMPS